ncbi:RING finger protein 17-like isoform X2 [Littorina saxatilis]|uniref:RING finger protein 17 n=1 Tax=Littorina saxatilis TaxID=31220 RepID=A0AAN9GGM0_9CAEN
MMKTPTCPRCHTLYSVKFKEHAGKPGKHPMLLRCGHTFCEACIQKCTRKDHAIDCPTCQVATVVGVDTDLHKVLNPDLFTVGMIWTRRMDLELQSQKIMGGEMARQKKRDKRGTPAARSGISCSECHINTATCQCIKCDCLMCRPCFDKVHQMSNSLRKHIPVGIPNMAIPDERLTLLKKTRSRNCSAHEQCQIEYFCKDDNQAICSRCVIMGDHKGHDVQTLEDKNKECLAEMEPCILTAQETIWRLDKSEKLMAETMPKAQIDSKEVEEEIRLHFRELHSFLQAREEQLLDEVKEASQNATKPIEDMRSYLQEEKMNLESALVDAARAMQGSIHRLIDADLVLERLKKAKDVASVVSVKKETMATPIQFSFDPEFKETMMSYGTVSATDLKHMVTLNLPGPDAERPPADELRHFSLPDLDTLSNTDTESIADSASVVVEEDKDDGDSTDDVMAEVVKTEPVKEVPSKRLIVGHCEKVQVTHIATPSRFYVQLASRRGELETMQRQINQHCRGPQGKKGIPEFVEPGCMVLAQYSADKAWYRVRVTTVIEPKEDEEDGKLMYEVFFIDYGNSDVVPLEKLRKMKKKFEHQPPFGYECSLYDILPANEEQGWTSEAVNTMLQMTRSGFMIMMVVNTVGGVLEVDLSKPVSESMCADDRPVSVRDSLVFLEMAIFNTRSLNSPTVFVPPVASRMTRDFITMPKVREGTVCEIAVNCVHSPSLFYVSVFNNHANEYLHRMLVSMQEMYTAETRHLYTIFCPRKGMICAARYQKDNNWYRARVTGLPGHRKVEVQFVDYGNTEIVDHSDLCKILDDFIKYPVQAIECSLADVEPLENGQWSKEAKAWFRSLAELQLCQIRVTEESSKANSMVGVLYAINNQNKLCCVNYEMVSHGFARSTGQWSQDESYLGITLRPELLQDLSSASSVSNMSVSMSTASPSSSAHSPVSPSLSYENHSKAGVSPSKPRQGPSPRKPQHSPAKPESKKPSQKSSGVRNGSVEKRKEGEKKGEASCQPDSGMLAVVISGYKSPAHFYIYLEDNQEKLLNLMVELADYETVPVTDREWKEGEFCVAKYSNDDRWYRARIVQKVADDLFEVQLMDYGYDDKVPGSCLRNMKKTHAKIECFSERCHLANILPAGSTDRTKWSNTAKEFVLKQVTGKRLFIKLEGDRIPEYGLPVDILIEETIPETAFDPQSHVYNSLLTLIQEKGLALPMRRGKSTEPLSSPNSTPAPTPASDTFHTKLFVSSDSLSVDSSDSRDDVTVSESVQEVKGHQEPVVIVQPDLDVARHPPPAATSLTVLPVYVDYEGIVYAHDFEEEEKATALSVRLDEYARKEAPDGDLEVHVGQVCLAHFDTDNAWYRARVLETTKTNVKVKYIDYGNTGRVDRTKLKLITPELCIKPQLAYEFRLHNIKPDTVDGTWPVSFLDYMHKQLVNKQCTAEVKGNLSHHPLEVELTLQDGSNISTVLLEIGVVVRDNDMQEFYHRSQDITDILRHSNPFFPLRLGEKGDFVHGIVTHIELPNLVYIQRCAAYPGNELPPDVEEFVQMMEDFNNLPPQTPALEEIPCAGEMCSAMFSQDNRWYRALVAKAYPADKTVLLFYVDYGNSEVVPLDRLRVLPARFQDTPAQALRAYLHLDLPDNAERWTMATYKAMAEAVFLRRHLILIKHTDPLTVELFCEEGEASGATILSYQQLINTGLVQLPEPLTVTEVEDDNVIVESETEEDCPAPDQNEEDC